MELFSVCEDAMPRSSSILKITVKEMILAADTPDMPELRELRESVQLPPAARFHISKLEDKYREQVLAMASTLVSLVDLKDCYTGGHRDRKSTRLNSSHVSISYAVFCLKKKKKY